MSKESAESKELDFSLPERKQASPKPQGRWGTVDRKILAALLMLIVLNLLVTWFKRSPEVNPPAATGFSSDSLKKLALKMEKQGLHTAAAETWREYQAATDLPGAESAKIWYRIGKLYQDGEQYEPALNAYYRSESLDPDTDLSTELSRRIKESLESLGKFTALKHELADRVSLNHDADSGEEVIAEIGAQKITRAEIDRQIEAMIDNQLAGFAAQMPAKQIKQQKEAMLKQFSGRDQTLQFLNTYIVQEILYRKARESNLLENPKVRAQLRDAERNLLAREMIETQLANQINITPGDVETYYRANSTNYIIPERARIRFAVVSDEEEAKAIIASGKLPENATDPEHWISKGGRIPEIGQVPDVIFSTAAGKIAADPVKVEKGFAVFEVREKQAKRQQPFEEVRDQVYRQLRQQKEHEVQARLLESLRDEYDVVIHHSKFQPNSEEK